MPQNLLKFVSATMDATPQLAFGQRDEPALDQLDPERAGESNLSNPKSGGTIEIQSVTLEWIFDSRKRNRTAHRKISAF